MTLESSMDILQTKPNGVSNAQFSDAIPSEPLSKMSVHEQSAEKDRENDAECDLGVQKKKKKKRSKKTGAKSPASEEGASQHNSNVLCISRNKHWKYISSYHGPWLQLPLELLESLLVLNLEREPATGERHVHSSSITTTPSSGNRLTGFARLRDQSDSRISSNSYDSYRYSPSTPSANASVPSPTLPPGKTAPPPIDPGAFRSVVTIRRLIDEAAELSVRASSGLSAAALGSLQASGSSSSFGLGGSPWTAAQALGLNPMGDFGGGGNGGRNVPMSATRVHRLRALAVQRLAEAYRADEIASSVMVMQRGTVFDDIADKVLKFDPKNVDARYVHFFHEKIPSRQLAESTVTTVLDQLIADNPQRLEFYRTRGIVHCFRDEYVLAARDFSHILKESRALRRAKQAHNPVERSKGENLSKARRKKGKVNGQAPPDGTATAIECRDSEQPLIHPAVLPDAPEPVELQALFLRGSAYFAHALFLIEEAIFKLEEIPRIPLNDFGEMQLSNISGKYGGTEINNLDGPLGRSDGVKARAYRQLLGDSPLREQVCGLLRKSKRDHEKFLANFDSIEPSLELLDPIEQLSDSGQKMERAFALLETIRPSVRPKDPLSTDATALSDVPLAFTTYHPLMLESYFSILNCLLMLGQLESLTRTFERTAGIVAGLEGYPVFLPPRSMAQAEFVETLERLASGWKFGKLPNALVRVRTPSGRPSRHLERPASTPLQSTSDDDSAAASSSSVGPSTSASATCSTKTSPAPGRRPSLGDTDADFTNTEMITSSRGDTEAGTDADPQAALRTSLEHLRFLLAPVRSRLHTRAENERARTENGKPAPLNFTLHSARVEVILAWLGAVHLPELEAVATP